MKKVLTDTGYMLVKGAKNLAKKAVYRLRGGDYTAKMNKKAVEWNESPEGKKAKMSLKNKWYGKFFE